MKFRNLDGLSRDSTWIPDFRIPGTETVAPIPMTFRLAKEDSHAW